MEYELEFGASIDPLTVRFLISERSPTLTSQDSSHVAHRGRKGIGVLQISKWGVGLLDLVVL